MPSAALWGRFSHRVFCSGQDYAARKKSPRKAGTSLGDCVGGGITAGRTMAFAVLSISQLVHAFNMRSEHSVFKAGIFKNPYLVLSLISGLILEVSVISVPYLANIFGVVPLNAMGWIVVTVLSVMPLIIVELQKFVSSFVWRKD